MYIQWFVKGISGAAGKLSWVDACNLLANGDGIASNWLRSRAGTAIAPRDIAAVLTDVNLDRHIHDYAAYGSQTPFVSAASGSVERDKLLAQNHVYSAVDTALDFATDAWSHPGTLFFGWIPVALNPAVGVAAMAEEVRDLNVYHRWSPFQLEGEITAKIYIPGNQLERAEWWDGSVDRDKPVDSFANPGFLAPTPITNVRELF